MELLYITLTIILILVLLFFIALYFVYRSVFYNNLKKKDQTYAVLKGKGYDEYYDVMYKLIDDATKIKYEKVSIKSIDGLNLSGKYYHVSDDANTCIQFHGYKGDAIRDMSGGLQFSLRMGLNVLLVDERSHALSDGKTISFGVLEKNDVNEWVKFINEKKNPLKKDIIIMGISMGASTVILASALKLERNVKAVIADCPYSDQKEVILNTVDQMKLNRKVVWPLIVLAGKLYGRFDIDDVKPIEAIRNSKLPTLIIQGDADYLVPPYMADDLYNANPSKVVLVKVKDAVHGVSYIYDREYYESECIKFLKELKLIK